jgi:iron complex transport system ATP-binding protein
MLRLIDVAVGYGKQPVLKNVNLSIGTGEIHGIIGLNGSGKSTLLRTILGMIPQIEGRILLDEFELRRRPLSERARRLSLLESQGHVAFPMTIRELLEISLRHSRDRALFDRSLEAVELRGSEERNLLEMSSGEVRRAFIAHTLCANAPIIMIDEPFSHLDWSHQKNLVESLKEWRSRFSTTFVLAIHELEWVVQIADRACALGNGSVLAEGPPEEVFRSERVREVFAFQSSIDQNPIDGSRRLTLGRPST